MEKLICKISVHVLVSLIITNFEQMITYVGRQATPLDKRRLESESKYSINPK
jgi:hypothetical protein